MFKAFIMLADAVATHSDGKASILNGGINHLTALAQTPIIFSGGMFARVEIQNEAPRELVFKLHCFDEGGKEIVPAMDLFHSHTGRDGSLNVAIGMAGFPFPGPGKFKFEFKLDNTLLAEWPLIVELKPKPEAPR